MAPLTVEQDALDHAVLNTKVNQALAWMDEIDALQEKLDDHKAEIKAIFKRRYEQDGKIGHETPWGTAKYIEQVTFEYPVELCLSLVQGKMLDELFPRKANKAAIRKLIDADTPMGLALQKVAEKDVQANLVLETKRQKARKAAQEKAKREAKKKGTAHAKGKV